MEIIVCIIAVVVIANLTGLSTWTVLFGLVTLLIAWFVWSLTRGAKQPAGNVVLTVRSRTPPSSVELGRKVPPSKSPSSFLSSGLIIRSEPLENILSGGKDWEMRAEKTHKREKIALIQKGSKRIIGIAEIVDCIGPLSHAEMVASYRHHLIEEARLDDPALAKYRYAWILSDVRRLRAPVEAPMKPGQVKFVNLPSETAAAVAAAL